MPAAVHPQLSQFMTVGLPDSFRIGYSRDPRSVFDNAIHFIIISAQTSVRSVIERMKDLQESGSLLLIGNVGGTRDRQDYQCHLVDALKEDLTSTGFNCDVRYLSQNNISAHDWYTNKSNCIGLKRASRNSTCEMIDPNRFINEFFLEIARNHRIKDASSAIYEEISQLHLCFDNRRAIVPLLGDDWRILSHSQSDRLVETTYETILYPHTHRFDFLRGSIAGALTHSPSLSLLETKARWSFQDKVHVVFDMLALEALHFINETIDESCRLSSSLIQAAGAEYVSRIPFEIKESMLRDAAHYLSLPSHELKREFIMSKFSFKFRTGPTMSFVFRSFFIASLYVEFGLHDGSNSTPENILTKFVDTHVLQGKLF